eukprot:CAMPEP_0176502232 /NCGR_PEP_ID=MMETSP0200_2-20121128/14634_1 /TAXON_ID=947934 /ORGANISM="Chaetoceros sp., Strain GSL56" /LENGTH=250 /DNA_ID=CAMNT_0017901271 /DNA_START=1199 /DNA_END=1951 /DNA_ORIENTATION=+
MGIVFGKTGVLEPPFQVLLTRGSSSSPTATTATVPVTTPYEIRNYGVRFACETIYNLDQQQGGRGGGSDGTGFRTLAGYIGVGTSPQNIASQGIAMTAPVVTSTATTTTTATNTRKGTSIAMTAPVVTTTHEHQNQKKMAFLLPQEYDSLDKIPKPTNPNVQIKQIPAAKGAVHTFSGWCDDTKAKSKARELVHQLQEDGVMGLEEEEVLKRFELWQFHPPFTIPMLRKNEVWIELSEDQVNDMLKKYMN